MTARGRSSLKHVAERFVVASGAAALLRRLRRDRDLILAYHNIVPDRAASDGERSLHLSRQDFSRQLDALVDTHEVVGLDDLLAGGGENGGRGSRARAAVTFDDGYRGALTAGLEELAARGLPATYFICPGLLGNDGFWWDALADRPRAGQEADAFRDEALQVGRGMAPNVYAMASARGIDRRTQPAHAGVATEEEIAAAAGVPRVTLASHSWTHPNLARLGPDELREELERSLRWLDQNGGGAARPWLSAPYGRSSPDVRKGAETAGYEAVFEISGGLARPGTDPLEMPRVNVPAGLSLEGFVLRASGL